MLRQADVLEPDLDNKPVVVILIDPVLCCVDSLCGGKPVYFRLAELRLYASRQQLPGLDRQLQQSHLLESSSEGSLVVTRWRWTVVRNRLLEVPVGIPLDLHALDLFFEVRGLLQHGGKLGESPINRMFRSKNKSFLSGNASRRRPKIDVSRACSSHRSLGFWYVSASSVAGPYRRGRAP